MTSRRKNKIENEKEPLKFSERVSRFFRALVDNVYVDKFNCIVCDKELQGEKRNGVCEKCAEKMTPLGDDICNKCGRIQLNEAEYCISCQNYPKNFGKARSCFVFEGEARAIVHRLKFGNHRYLAKYMANAMVDRYLDCGFDCDVVTPVPLSAKRRRKRGYNQAELIAKKVAIQLKLPLSVSAVKKIRDTDEQARKAGVERMLNVRDAYAVGDASQVADKKVLLIDDVMSTGATTSEVAKMLFKAKARDVQVLTYCSTKYKLQSETNRGEENEN
ncbi:MAG: ComF family protein [Clostridia bacterium]